MGSAQLGVFQTGDRPRHLVSRRLATSGVAPLAYN